MYVRAAAAAAAPPSRKRLQFFLLSSVLALITETPGAPNGRRQGRGRLGGGFLSQGRNKLPVRTEEFQVGTLKEQRWA